VGERSSLRLALWRKSLFVRGVKKGKVFFVSKTLKQPCCLLKCNLKPANLARFSPHGFTAAVPSFAMVLCYYKCDLTKVAPEVLSV
jgi:hypothetical protein